MFTAIRNEMQAAYQSYQTGIETVYVMILKVLIFLYQSYQTGIETPEAPA